MFNGIIFNQGVIKKITKRDKGINIFINSNLKLTKKDIGVSVASDGVCLTLIKIKNNIIKTAPESNLILPGVTRKFLIDEVSVRSNIDISIENYTEDDLKNADEVFITNSTQGILPITKLNNNVLNKKSFGPVTEILHKEFIQHIF